MNWWQKKNTKMVGLQKGLKRVLKERQVNVAKIQKADMIKALEEMRDFKFQKAKVEKLRLCLFQSFIKKST